jgi:hypothetical protein
MRRHFLHLRPPTGAPGSLLDELPRWASSTLLNDSSATTGPAFPAFFHCAHSAFSLRANAEPNTADHHTDTRRRWSFLNNSASLRGWLLNDVVVGKAGGNDESRQSGTGQNWSHEKCPFRNRTDFVATHVKWVEFQ